MKSKKLLRGGTIAIDNIIIQRDIILKEIQEYNLFSTIITILEADGQNPKNTAKITDFLTLLNAIEPTNNINTVSNKVNIFEDIYNVVNTISEDKPIKDNNFQSKIYRTKTRASDDDDIDIFTKYELYKQENSRKFITIDPGIIQIMIFDHEDTTTNDIVYSLKLIIRSPGTLTLRYTTQLFPSNSKITTFNNLTTFNNFNKSLGNTAINDKYDTQLREFLKKYIKFYNFYKKCYFIQDTSEIKKIIDYQLKYISILGKARFGYPEIQKKTVSVTEYVMANLIFTSPAYAFISGGYKGFKQVKYGVTRSGYEIAKKYNRPVLTIMCEEGTHDAHEYADAELIYGEHWGEDSIALSQLTDGAIIIAPFGGWTYIECLTLLENKKIVGIYNNLYNILNYTNKELTHEERTNLITTKQSELPTLTTTDINKIIDNELQSKIDNINFFKFTPTEQYNIIDYYINYYLILLYLCLISNPREQIQSFNTINIFKVRLNCGICVLMDLKATLKTSTIKPDDESIPLEIIPYIDAFKLFQCAINAEVTNNLIDINDIYISKCRGEYQNKIPEKCDGIWIKPKFSLIDDCIKNSKDSTPKSTSRSTPRSTSGSTPRNTSGSTPRSTTKDILGSIPRNTSGSTQNKLAEFIKRITVKYEINYDSLKAHPIFNGINNNIIFVFSDVLHLNLYLNENLNSIEFQKRIHEKISELSQLRDPSAPQLSRRNTSKNITLNKNMDGIFDILTSQIMTEHKIADNYSFIIKETCNDYTHLLTDSNGRLLNRFEDRINK
jgi:hypothetical protein